MDLTTNLIAAMTDNPAGALMPGTVTVTEVPTVEGPRVYRCTGVVSIILTGDDLAALAVGRG